MLNTINIGQSVKCYHLSHVRNHHRYNNDAKNADGLTMDSSSTYLEGENGEHASLSRYAFHGAIVTIINIGRLLLTAWLRFWRVSDAEKSILNLLATSADRRKSELLQIQLDRIALFFGLVLFLSISWQWTLFCLIPAFYLALALVNIQNYYEHYGANPNDLLANSVSYYGRLYNWLSFNDGYHQEHHLSFGAHWQQMPTVKATKLDNAENVERIISPVPAIIGYFDRNRKLLHKLSPTQPITNNVIEEIPG
jgi:fatty acid desaturase